MNFKTGKGAVAVIAGVVAIGCGGTTTGDTSGYSSGPGRTLDDSTVSSANSFGAATLGSKLIPMRGKPAFANGINVSSFSGSPDVDFGKNPLQPQSKVAFDTKTVEKAIKNMSALGSNVIRIELFHNLDGIKLDSNGLVAGLDDTFVKNLSDTLSQADKAKMQVYVCLNGSWNGLKGVTDPVTDANARSAYLKKAVTPLVGKLKGRSNVFGIDVFNEIESEIAGKDGNSTEKGITWEQAREYIKATVDVIKSVDPQRLVSCGSGLHGWQTIMDGDYSNLGLDFYDFHFYDDNGQLPPAKELKVNRPVLIGACGQSSKKVDPDVQAKSDIAIMTSALKQGYAGALISDYGASASNPLSLLDKDGKYQPVLQQFTSFVTTTAKMGGTTITK